MDCFLEVRNLLLFCGGVRGFRKFGMVFLGLGFLEFFVWFINFIVYRVGYV